MYVLLLVYHDRRKFFGFLKTVYLPNIFTYILVVFVAFSALTLLLGGRKGIRLVKTGSGVVLVWLSVWIEMQTCIWPS